MPLSLTSPSTPSTYSVLDPEMNTSCTGRPIQVSGLCLRSGRSLSIMAASIPCCRSDTQDIAHTPYHLSPYEEAALMGIEGEVASIHRDAEKKHSRKLEICAP